MKLDKKYANEWLNKLKKYWFEKDLEKVINLFCNTSFYQETPFIKPYIRFEEIIQEWQHVQTQTIKKIEFEILAIDNNVLIVNWIFDNGTNNFDGIYEIKFNDRLECIYFKSWKMKR